MKKSAIALLICLRVITAFSQEMKFASEPENLGENINSSASEISPLISPDGKKLFFTRKDHPRNTGGTENDDIWFSELRADGSWSVAKNIGSPQNNTGNNSVCSITPDNNLMLLFGKYNYYDGTMSKGVSISTRDKRGWVFPKAQKIIDFENRNDYANYYLSSDGKILLLSVETKKSLGDLDLYVSFLTENGSWSKPENLGNTINTKVDDGTPFLSSDNKTLYFYSAGHGGFGDADIFMAKRLDDTWQKWSKPLNMGNKINGPGWDAYFTLPASGEYAYFVSSNNSLGKSDIFRIRLPVEAKPEPVVLISGRVINSKTNEPVFSEIRYEILPSGEEAGIAHSEPVSGIYKIVLPYGKKYGFMAKADGFYAVSDNLDVSALNEYKEIERDLFLSPVEINKTVRLNNIFFESGKAILKEESFPELKRVIELLEKNPGFQIEIAGHTDDVGADIANMQLSLERAQSVVNYLSKNGIKAGRLSARGYGETVPVAGNETEEGRQKNRRVELKILSF